MRFSIYTSAFNLVKNEFDYASALDNFTKFAQETVIAINSSNDGTLDAIQTWKRQNPERVLRIIQCDIPYDDPLLDGKIKDAALQQTTGEILIGLDIDERILLSQKEKWIELAYGLEFTPFDSFLIPSLDLWGSYDEIRWDEKHNKKWKWYLHKKGLKRGPVDFGLTENGFLNLDKSDGCELTYPDGKLVRAQTFTNNPKDTSLRGWLDFLKESPFIVHLGYLNLDNRIHRNKEFWSKHWSLSANKDIKVPLDKRELEHSTFAHGLDLEEIKCE
jgi:hypothetical protein